MLGENRQKRGSGLVINETRGDNSVTLLAGVDAGSTETRVCLADKNDVAVFSDSNNPARALEELTKTYCVPSTYANVEDAREISPQSQNLEDNYDSTVMLVSNGAQKPLVGRHRVIRGRKIQDAMGATQRYLDSSTNKTDNVIFYVNIIDAVGYAVLQKYNGAIPHEVTLHLVLSVRPKELTSICKKKMMENLLGSYIFTWRSVDIRITIKSLQFSTEPEAQISGTTTVYDLRASAGTGDGKYADMADKLYGSDCYIHVEGGGSSVGVEVIRYGEIIDAASSTFPLGGNYMAQVFIDRYREMSGRTVTKEAANAAIISCMLRDGSNTIDVSDVVAACKNQVALDIVERLRHEVIDTMSTLTMHEVEFISLGGRLFKDDAAGNNIGQYFAEYIQQLSPNTEVFVLAENFIAQGNLCIGLNSDYCAELTEAAEAEPAKRYGVSTVSDLMVNDPSDTGVQDD